MGELTVDMFVTLDGVVQGPGAPDEDAEDEFRHGGWQGPYMDDESGARITENIERMDALLLGRKTYDIFSGYWPNQPKGPISTKLNEAPKYVASRTLKTVDWQNSSLIKGDVAATVPKMKNEHDEIHTLGSANLVQTLLQYDLVDRFYLWIYPVVLGEGKRLFAEGAVPSALKLEQTAGFPKGAVMAEYRRVGKPTYVDMAAEGPPTG